MMLWFREPWRTRALFASVACNLFLLALVGVQVLRPHGGSSGMTAMVERMARDLPADDAARFRAALAHEADWRQEARQRMDEARAELSRSIMQTPYDERLVRARMVSLQQVWAESSNRFGDSLIAAIGTLSPEGRARLAVVAEQGHRK